MATLRKRLVVRKPGGYKALNYEAGPIPEPASGEVRVKVHACGINFADIAVRLGLYGAAKGLYPLCPGLEFAGEVQDTGSKVRDFEAGNRVFGVSRFGGCTTAINCPVEQIWHLPSEWDFSRGASFPVVYLTAFYGLYYVGHLESSDKALVHSAAGGVGTALIHLLKINHNDCIGVVGKSPKVSHAASAGATHVIDKETRGLWETAERLSPEGYDMILDANGASTLRESYRHLKPAGRLLIYGFSSMFSPSGRKNWIKMAWDYVRTPRFNPFDLTASNKTVSGFNLIHLFDKVDLFRGIMDKLLAWDSKGLLPTMPITEYPFEKAVEAQRALESGDTVGKLVLITGQGAS